MTVTDTTPAPSTSEPSRPHRTGRWIDDWEPEDPAFWDARYRGPALAFGTFRQSTEAATRMDCPRRRDFFVIGSRQE